MSRPFANILLVALALSSAASARGEVFLLKSGGRIEGDLLNPERGPTDPFRLKTALGLRLELAPSAVARTIVKSDVQKQYEQLLPKMPPTADGNWRMAEWCKEAGLISERKRHLASVIAAEPDHEPARTALGYSRYGSKWMTQDEYMISLGYIRNGGRYRPQQEIELEAAANQRESEVKKHRKQIKNWFDQFGKKGQQAAINGLQALRDPLAAPALAEILADDSQPMDYRLLCLEILGKMPPGLADGVLTKLVMEEQSANILDRALDELRRSPLGAASAVFIKELQSKDNKRVNRAAYCLAHTGFKESATLPLINALVTKHEYLVTTGSGGPQVTPGGMSAGSKTERIKRDEQNEKVLNALISFHPGVNYQFDKDAWKAWYIKTFTTTHADLRRDE